jgi:predicted ATPase with chaperone activity
MTSIAATVDMPPAPKSVEETGLSSDLIIQIATKTLHIVGEMTGTQLAARLGVPFQVIEPSLDLLKRDRHCEITGGALLGPPSYTYRLTDAGRVRAMLFMESNRYVGALPVPLHQYTAYMNDFARQNRVIATRDRVKQAFSHLVLSTRVLDQLGPAIAAWHSLFVYGPPGNGKTVIAQAIRNVLFDEVLVPHALSIDGHIIRVYDSVNHEPTFAAEEEHALGTFERGTTFDQRWVRCRRPLVTAGGEMTLESLELGYTGGGFYRAPLQVIANGGVLVIDDFGRQQVSARNLLNRWIVPLEAGVDYLTLRTGEKFQIPFQTFVVFATNLKPSDLADEAFLRRIRYKVLAESPSVDEFVEIFENYCRTKHLTFERAVVDHLIERELRPRGIPMRGCHPRDLIEHTLAIARYLDEPARLTPDLISEACASYFVEDRDLATA